MASIRNIFRSQIQDEEKRRKIRGLFALHLESLESRLSFPATGPPDPKRVSEGFQKGSLKGL